MCDVVVIGGGPAGSARILYIYNAGNTIDLYLADGYRYLRTIVLDADTTTGLFVLPHPDGPAAGG